MLNVINTLETTTKNARKMKYYTMTFGDGTVKQLTKDIQGNIFLDGVKITDAEYINQINEIILSIKMNIRKPW